VVDYVVSSLRDWAGGCSQAAVTTGKNSGLATTVGFGCGSGALCSSVNSVNNSEIVNIPKSYRKELPSNGAS